MSKAAAGPGEARWRGGRERTRRRDGAAEQRRAEERFTALAESVREVVVRFAPDLRCLYVSPAIEPLTGRPAAAFLGRTSREAGMAQEPATAWEAALRRVFATGHPERLALALPTPEGARRFECRLVAETVCGGDAVAAVLGIAREVTDRWLVDETERHSPSLAEAMREATVRLNRSLDRETVLATLLECLRWLVPFDRAQVMLLEDGSRLSVRAVSDGGRVILLPAAERPEIDTTDHPVIRDMLSAGAAVVVSDIRGVPAGAWPAEPSAEASWMGVPLFARGEVTGLLTFSRREPGPFAEEHVRVAEVLASQASVAVENAILYQQMQASKAAQRSLSRRLVEAQERERRHIARELHDEAAQALASLRFGLHLLESEVAGGGGVTTRVAELRRTTDAVIDGLHRLAAHLRPASLDYLGLVAALQQYSRSTAARFGLVVRFKARGFTDERLPAVVETALFRIVQEAMTNVVRHARASRVDVLLERRGDRILAMVEDDGVGFEPESVHSGEHFGLVGLRERAEALDGSLTVESEPGAGTTVVAEIPSADPHPDR